MGTTAQYVMISKKELDELLSGDAQRVVDEVYDERYGFGARFAPTNESFPQEVAANPLAMLDYDKVSSYVNQIMANITEQQALSKERLQSLDDRERIDEICKLYAWNERPWQSLNLPREFGASSEDDLALEAIRRGYHLRLDLDKRWDAMHELLTGITLRERWDLDMLARARPWIEKAILNANFPRRCVQDVEESREAVREMGRVMFLLWRELEDKVSRLPYDEDELADDDDGPDGGDKLRDQLEIVEDIVIRKLWRAPDTIYRCVLQIATMQKKCDDAGSNVFGDQFINGLVESAKCAKTIESSMSDILSKLRTNQCGDAEKQAAATVLAESKRLEGLLSVPGWAVHFSAQAMPISSPTLSGDDDLLSISVSGAEDVPGLVRHESTYITVEQTRAIAQALDSLTSESLAKKHHLSDDGGYDFAEFKKFYLRAAKFESGILVFFG